jgi:hypothetical protein
MIELFITAENDRSNVVLQTYQFTINGKFGGMSSTLDKNYKITN